VQQETFISYKGYRWLVISLAVTAILSIIYFVDAPVGGRNGATVVGYTYGTLAALGIVWLMFYGVRKRSYSSSIGTVQGWLAAHVWIGIALLLIVPLHSGFSFHWNVHTLAYALMVVTILTGIWGMVNYARLSERIESHRGGGSNAAMLERIYACAADAEALCRGKSDAFLEVAHRLDFAFSPSIRLVLGMSAVPTVDHALAGELLAKVPEAERDECLRVVGLIDQKSDLATSLIEESRVKALLRAWLFLHVPASVALCGALAIHILSVFLFW
jgi:hypothetical protein